MWHSQLSSDCTQSLLWRLMARRHAGVHVRKVYGRELGFTCTSLTAPCWWHVQINEYLCCFFFQFPHWLAVL
jgi:hypothetical protein